MTKTGSLSKSLAYGTASSLSNHFSQALVSTSPLLSPPTKSLATSTAMPPSTELGRKNEVVQFSTTSAFLAMSRRFIKRTSAQNTMATARGRRKLHFFLRWFAWGHEELFIREIQTRERRSGLLQLCLNGEEKRRANQSPMVVELESRWKKWREFGRLLWFLFALSFRQRGQKGISPSPTIPNREQSRSPKVTQNLLLNYDCPITISANPILGRNFDIKHGVL